MSIVSPLYVCRSVFTGEETKSMERERMESRSSKRCVDLIPD